MGNYYLNKLKWDLTLFYLLLHSLSTKLKLSGVPLIFLFPAVVKTFSNHRTMILTMPSSLSSKPSPKILVTWPKMRAVILWLNALLLLITLRHKATASNLDGTLSTSLTTLMATTTILSKWLPTTSFRLWIASPRGCLMTALPTKIPTTTRPLSNTSPMKMKQDHLP